MSLPATGSWNAGFSMVSPELDPRVSSDLDCGKRLPWGEPAGTGSPGLSGGAVLAMAGECSSGAVEARNLLKAAAHWIPSPEGGHLIEL